MLTLVFVVFAQTPFNKPTDVWVDPKSGDIFITDGSTCYPQAVEDVLLKHDRVNGAVVIGIGYSDIYIEEGLPGLDHPVAFVTANLDRSELTEEGLVEELMILCDAHLQRDLGEIPIKIFVMTDFPKTTNGKILRNDLKSLNFGILHCQM